MLSQPFEAIAGAPATVRADEHLPVDPTYKRPCGAGLTLVYLVQSIPKGQRGSPRTMLTYWQQKYQTDPEYRAYDDENRRQATVIFQTACREIRRNIGMPTDYELGPFDEEIADGKYWAHRRLSREQWDLQHPATPKERRQRRRLEKRVVWEQAAPQRAQYRRD